MICVYKEKKKKKKRKKVVLLVCGAEGTNPGHVTHPYVSQSGSEGDGGSGSGGPRMEAAL